jgi:hypothetical protein
LGHFTQQHTPAGRGFDDFFGFLFGSETHDSHNSWGRHTCNVPIIDLYNTTRRANESIHYLNMTYSPEMYAQEMKRYEYRLRFEATETQTTLLAQKWSSIGLG